MVAVVPVPGVALPALSRRLCAGVPHAGLTAAHVALVVARVAMIARMSARRRAIGGALPGQCRIDWAATYARLSSRYMHQKYARVRPATRNPEVPNRKDVSGTFGDYRPGQACGTQRVLTSSRDL